MYNIIGDADFIHNINNTYVLDEIHRSYRSEVTLLNDSNERRDQ